MQRAPIPRASLEEDSVEYWLGVAAVDNSGSLKYDFLLVWVSVRLTDCLAHSDFLGGGGGGFAPACS